MHSTTEKTDNNETIFDDPQTLINKDIELFYKALEKHYSHPIVRSKKRRNLPKLFTVNNKKLKK